MGLHNGEEEILAVGSYINSTITLKGPGKLLTSGEHFFVLLGQNSTCQYEKLTTCPLVTDCLFP